MSADKDAHIAFVQEVQRLQEESNRLHLVAVTAKQNLMRETRKYDEHLAEFERKLAEQQAALFTIRTIVAGCDSEEAISTIRHLQKHFDDQHAELNNLLAKAKEEGRREAVQWQLIENAPHDDSVLVFCNGHVFMAGQVDGNWHWGIAVPDSMRLSLKLSPTHWIPLPAAPKPQGETSCQ